MNSKYLTHLDEHDQNAISALIKQLYANYGHDIYQLALFGSKARGDSRADSDIDVLVVTSHEPWSFNRRLLRLGADVSLQHNVLFNLYVTGQKHWYWMGQVQHPLYRTIQSEGVRLSPA